MAKTGVASIVLLISCYAAATTCYGAIHFDSLENTFTVTATHEDKILKAGEDNITVGWAFDKSLKGTKESEYKKLKFQLCYSKESQKDRGWRKTVADDIKKDKTCQFEIVVQPYPSLINSYTSIVKKNVPTAKYFVRVYAYNSAGHEIAYGQNTNANKTDNLFNIQSISGRHATLDICSVTFSAFSIIALFGFFFMEKRNAKIASAQQN